MGRGRGPVGLRLDDSGHPVLIVRGANQMLFHVETFPIGTVFSTWLKLCRPTPLEAAFFTDILDTFRTDGRLGGRIGIGHGEVRTNLTPDQDPTTPTFDWRSHVTNHRTEILHALEGLA